MQGFFKGCRERRRIEAEAGRKKQTSFTELIGDGVTDEQMAEAVHGAGRAVEQRDDQAGEVRTSFTRR
ncbi:hypothetical protein U1Q18_029384 [Sarracenia purpurea var. burkii]